MKEAKALTQYTLIELIAAIEALRGERLPDDAIVAELRTRQGLTNELEKKRRLLLSDTKDLLSYLTSARACGGWYSPCGDSSSSFGYTVEELKEELAKREHVPNKQEAREIRQQKAKGQ